LGPWGNALFLSFILAALPEELSKLWVIGGYSARQESFDEPMDGLVYGSTAALGFAALENALYVFSGGWAVALVRAFTAVPMHAMTGAILGYGVSQARFGPRSSGVRFPAVIAAMLVHGGYNFFLFAANFTVAEGTLSASRALALTAGAGGVLLIAAIWTFRTVRRLRREQLSCEIPLSEESNP
jgi:RsiW-degrading membrane proteinase PrsW (M82 family)